jgi:hypothetical protein
LMLGVCCWLGSSMWSLTPLTSSIWRVCQFEMHWLFVVVKCIYRNLRSLGNGTESVEGREGEGGELERDHGCLSVWFLGGVVRCKRSDGISRARNMKLWQAGIARPRARTKFQWPRPGFHHHHFITCRYHETLYQLS